jgi:hypothetical protein
VSKKDLAALESEGHRLLAFAFPQGESFDVQVVL